MPFPSRGCRTCRQRRLKCDETRPACGQCKRSSRACLGFESDQAGLPFRNENAYASGVARRPRKPAANEYTKSSPLSSTLSKGKQNSALKQIPLGIGVSLEELAFNYYLHTHMFTADELPITIQGLIEKNNLQHEDRLKQSLLATMVSATSLVTFGRIKRCSDALQLGNQKYVQALAKIKVVVTNMYEATTDHFLLTVLMLGVYEHTVSRYEKEFFLSESFRHLNGAMSILRLRRIQHHPIAPLDKIARNLIVRQAVLHAVALPEWLQDGAEYGEQGVELDLDACLVKLAMIRCRAQQLWVDLKSIGYAGLEQSLQDLQKEARNADQMLAQLAANLPLEWTYTIQGDSSLVTDIENADPERLYYSSTFSLYPSLAQAAAWNRYRAARIVVHCILLKIMAYQISACHDDNEVLEKYKMLLSASQEEVKTCIKEICESIPYHFNILSSNRETPWNGKPRHEQISAKRAYLLSWPLTIMMAVGFIPQHQKEWIRSKVRMISRITGNGALELVSRMEENINLKGDSHSISRQREEMGVESET